MSDNELTGKSWHCFAECRSWSSKRSKQRSARLPAPSQRTPNARNSTPPFTNAHIPSTSTLPSSVIAKAASPTPTPLDKRQSERTVLQDADVIFQELWDAALEKARQSVEDQHVSNIIDAFATKAMGDESLGARELATVIKDEMEHEINSQYHDGSTSRFVRQVVSTLTKFAVLGDVAVSVDPVHAALPWVAMRLVLMVRVSCDRSGASLTIV